MARLRIGDLRTRLSAAVLVAVALALAAMALIFNVVLGARLSADAQSVARSRADAELASLTTVGGRLRLREAPDDAALDSSVWVFAGRMELERPTIASASVERAVRRLASGRGGAADVPGTDLRLLSVPARKRGRRVGTVVAGVSLKPYDHTRHIALLASVILCALVLAVVLAMARWVIAHALRPVSRMTAQAAEWSEADTAHRFAMGPPRDELGQLAATLDGLLQRLSDGMRREQRSSAEISHELRTPLAKIRAEAEIALRRRRTPAAYRDALESVLRTAERMTAVIDTLLVAARAEAQRRDAVCDAVVTAGAAAESCRRLAERRGVRLVVKGPPGPVRVPADEELLERILFPLIENGCRYAAHEVIVEVVDDSACVGVHIFDDGPGVSDAERDAIFEPGGRGSAGEEDEHGAGLGLSLARRLARQLGGDVAADPGGDGGHFHVELPRSR